MLPDRTNSTELVVAKLRGLTHENLCGQCTVEENVDDSDSRRVGLLY